MVILVSLKYPEERSVDELGDGASMSPHCAALGAKIRGNARVLNLPFTKSKCAELDAVI